MPSAEHNKIDEDDFPESQLVPGLGFSGLGSEIGNFLRKLLKRLTPSH